jgi:glycopeptide antibiotics resistance protein
MCLVAAIGFACLIAYGSLVPFDLRSGALGSGASLDHVRFTPWSRVSPTDVFVNVVVAVPLGFFLMGALLRPSIVRRVPLVGTMLGIAGLSALLATCVEILQVLLPARNSSWNDVLAQSSGALCGALTWRFMGARLMQWLRDLAGEHDASQYVGRLLQLYLPLYAVLQFTPDHVLRDAAQAASYEPGRFTAIPVASVVTTAVAVHHFCTAAALTIPIGLLAALGWVKPGTQRTRRWALLLGCFVVIGIAVPRAVTPWSDGLPDDMLAGVLGVVIGVSAATACSRRGEDGWFRPSHRLRPWLLAAAGAWTCVLIAYDWYPFSFEFTSEAVRRRLTGLSPFPFASSWYASYRTNPWHAVHETLLMFLLAVPLGSLLRLSWPAAVDSKGQRRQGIAIVAGATAVLAAIEVGQIFLPMRLPDVTDALVASMGALAGCAAATPLVCRRLPRRRARSQRGCVQVVPPDPSFGQQATDCP